MQVGCYQVTISHKRTKEHTLEVPGTPIASSAILKFWFCCGTWCVHEQAAKEAFWAEYMQLQHLLKV